MLVQLVSFDGHILNDADYRSVYLTPNQLPAAQVVYIEEAMADSVDAGTYTVENRIVPISITILSASKSARDILVGQLKSWFKRGTEGDLVATFTDEAVSYQLSCRVQNLIPDPDFPQHFTAMLVSGDTDWRSVSLETTTWAVTGTGGTKTITVHGDDETRLIARFSATASPSGIYLYQRLYTLINMPGIDYGKRAWCIMMNTVSLVNAGKMRADCNDLRLFDGNGNEFYRWLEDKNTAYTQIWFNLHIGPGYSLALRTAIAASGEITTIDFAKNPGVLASLTALPASGVFYHGTEWIHYDGKDLANYRLNVDQRGLFDTTLQVHNVGEAFLFIETPVIMLYGNAAATDPAVEVGAKYDYEKPVFDLGDSNNTSWSWITDSAGSGFYDPLHPSRPGSWTRYLQCAGTVSHLFWTDEDAEIGIGNRCIGCKLGCWQEKNGVWQLASGTLAWSLYCPGGIAYVTAGGKKYRSSVRWPTTAALQRSADWVNWYNVWNEATPASASSWTAWTHARTAMASGTKHVRFCLAPSLAVLANAYASLEATGVTVEFTSANLPTGVLEAERTNYAMDIELTNNENGDRITLNYPMRLSTVYRIVTLLIDGENYRATYDGHEAHRAMRLDDESRPVWLRLQPGANELEISASRSGDVGTLAVALSWYRRHL